MRVIVVAGARPNFIKIAPLMPALEIAGIEAEIAHTGQHYDAAMSDVFFEDLEIPAPRWSLDAGSGTHAEQTGRALMRLEEVFAAEVPDCVIVVGDVNSTLAGALAATKLGIPVVHLEAGLRSRDMSMPEEINRILTDRIATLLLTPSRDADENLIAEGVSAARIEFVGNIMAESLLRNRARAVVRETFAKLGLERNGYVLSTIHRPENTDDPARLEAIVQALDQAPYPVVLLAHPRTRNVLDAMGISIDDSNVRILDPVGYLDMLSLQEAAALVVTDSGGLQEESCILGVPCVTVRNNTERPVTVDVGANRVVSATVDGVAAGIAEAFAAPRGWHQPERWDTEVAARVAAVLTRADEVGFPPFEGARR